MNRTASSAAILALAVLIAPLALFAQSEPQLIVTPVVIDEKAKARDILKETLTIENVSNRKLNLYPSVNDVDVASGTEQFVSAQSGEDRKDSLANWIELSRGVIEISPGEKKEIPFVIRVNLNALPGAYHANISFFEGSTREQAEATRPLAVAVVNTEVQADIKETMQLNKFLTDNFFFSGDDVLFTYQLENIGNQQLKPKGEIRIYDRKGREVASVPVNQEGKVFTPDEAAQLASAWSAATGFGKFKAFLNIDYGSNQNGTLQDTVFFWIIPWQQLLIVGIIAVIAVVVSALYFHRWLEQRHMQKFALVHGAIPPAIPAPRMPQHEPAPAAALIVPPVTLQTKRPWFARFRRAKAAPELHVQTELPPVLAPTIEVPPPQSVPPAPTPPPSPAAPQVATRPGAIDLKNMSTPQAQPPKAPGHIINLKNPS